MPKNADIKARIRALMADQDLPYAEARRRVLAAQAATTGDHPDDAAELQDGLGDPTAADVAAYARLLMDRLRTRRGEAARPDCTDAWAFTRAIDAAMAAGLDLVDQAEAGQLDRAAVERAKRVAQQIQAAQRLTHGALNFNMVHDVAAGFLLVRGTRAVQRGRCMLGQAAATDCTDDPGRVRLRVHDTYGGTGHEDTDAGCLQHAAEEWTRWDHGGEVTIEIIGPADTATAVAQLGAELRDQRRGSRPEQPDAEQETEQESGQVREVPSQVLWEPLGVGMLDEDVTRNGLWQREGLGTSVQALGWGENWNYGAIEDAWLEHAAAVLAERGIIWRYDERAPYGDGPVLIPAGMTLETAQQIWESVYKQCDEWIADVVEQTRAGASAAPAPTDPDDEDFAGTRPESAPGARWVTLPTA